MEGTNMSESPYAPPKALVADVEILEGAMERPWQVSRAVTCLWIKLGVGVANSLWNLAHTPAQIAFMGRGFVYSMFAVGFLLAAWIYRSVGKGRNWARILVLVLTVFTFFGLPYLLYQVNIGVISGLVGIFGVVTSCLGIYAAYLLLTAPAKAWYRSMKGRS
jgi:heme A synthase